jgi:hypothetical protein
MQVRDERFWIGAAWGLVAILIMSVLEAAFLLFGTDNMREAMPIVLAARVIARVADVRTLTPGVFVGATIVQFLYGALWAGLLAASTAKVTVGKGIVISLGLMLISFVFLWPFGGQVFAFSTSGGAWLASLLVHLTYGVSIGILGGRHEPELIEEPV